MKVKSLVNGKLFDVPEDFAQSLIAAGKAVLIDNIEAEPVPAPEPPAPIAESEPAIPELVIEPFEESAPALAPAPANPPEEEHKYIAVLDVRPPKPPVQKQGTCPAWQPGTRIKITGVCGSGAIGDIVFVSDSRARDLEKRGVAVRV